MLERSATTLGIDLGASWIVGDILDDVEAGHRAGCRAVLLVPGGETVWRWSPDRVPDVLAPDLPRAVSRLLAADRARERSTGTVAA
jgi:phosphoglycolate phosphatase-like HAD superfamily hydrolase